jgi:hypothetical protein
MPKITFTNTWEDTDFAKPKPAALYVPEWYKKQSSYIGGEKKPPKNGGDTTNATIKRCMPVFDAMTAGYIIESPADVYVSKAPDGKPYYQWANFGAITFHPIEQADEHPRAKENFSFPKWMSPWAIKTSKGCSILVVPPMHRESPFRIFEGIIDTDTYNIPVNFPFALTDFENEFMIPAGTPIAQIIPFKREKWESELGGEEENNEQKTIRHMLRSNFFDFYKNKYRVAKEYK